MNQTAEVARTYTPPAGRKYLFTDDLVRITGIPATTWQKWRSLKKGPPYRSWAAVLPMTRWMSRSGMKRKKL